jgi:hypothetical protein
MKYYVLLTGYETVYTCWREGFKNLPRCYTKPKADAFGYPYFLGRLEHPLKPTGSFALIICGSLKSIADAIDYPTLRR